MFIRIKRSANSPRKTVQIVESKRIGGRVRQRILAYVGVIMNDEDNDKIMAIAQDKMLSLIKERSLKNGRELTNEEALTLTKSSRKKLALLSPKKHEIDLSKLNLNYMIEEYRFVDGVDDIVGGLFDSFGFNYLLKSPIQGQLLKDVTLARLVFPQSKLKLRDTMLNKFGKRYSEDQIYRMMDKLYPQINKIKQVVFNKTHALMPNINVLLFDVTTLYCESIDQDGLREFGFSKDGKFNNTQLVLALATNECGLPIGYELFPGNYAEVKTLLFAINKWNEMFKINSACFIGDRAMFSEDNISLIEECGYQYIIAAKLRGTSKNLQNEILNEDNYQNIKFGEENGKIAEFDYPNKITYVKFLVTKNINNELGYIINGTKNNIIDILHIIPDGTIKLVGIDTINQIRSAISKLRYFTSRCKCTLMTKEEYSLFVNNAEMLKDVAIVVDYDVIYNGEKISISVLSDKQQSQLISTVINNKISNSIMKSLFKDHYTYKTYINVPCNIMVKLFPEYKIPKRRLCVSYKPSRASNDEHKRNRILERLKNKEGSSNKVVKTVAKMYMTTTGESTLSDLKIIEDEKWDGMHGVITNIMADKPQDILLRYSNLWRIEEAFRINKHNLKMRPIYHYKPERIHTHIAMCYMAFALIKLIQYQTQITQPRFTIDNILETLLSVQSSIYVDLNTNIRYKMPGCMSSNAEMLYRAFGIKRTKQLAVYEN